MRVTCCTRQCVAVTAGHGMLKVKVRTGLHQS